MRAGPFPAEASRQNESVAQRPCFATKLEAGEGIEPIVDAFKERRPATERTRQNKAIEWQGSNLCVREDSTR
jgi:hypothetical protein